MRNANKFVIRPPVRHQAHKMRIVDYQRQGVDINTLPISRLRAIDIQTPDEEKEVARIIAGRNEPIPQGRVFIEDIKRRMDKEITARTLTKEKELEYQKEIDDRMAKAVEVKAEESSETPLPESVVVPEVPAVPEVPKEPTPELKELEEVVSAKKIKKLKKK